MGESDRYREYRGRHIRFTAEGNALMILVCINAVLFLTGWFLEILSYMTHAAAGNYEQNILPWFMMPAKLSSLLSKPWTLFSQMFMHVRLIPLLTNMVWLWAFGTIFQLLTGNRRIIPLYLYGGLAGAAAFIAANYIVPSLRINIGTSYLLGANAATMAIAIAATALAPDYRFFRNLNGGIPIWVLTLLYVIIDFVGIASGSLAYNISHLAGALIGFLFVISLKRGLDWTDWMNRLYNWFMNLFDPHKKNPPQRRIKEKVFYNTGNQKPFVKRSNITQQRIDEILDKINQKGYSRLTEEEKNILKRAGEADL